MSKNIPSVLHQMQAMLTRFYDAPTSLDVMDFLITDRAVVAAYTQALPADHTDEQVLLQQTEAGTRIGVYIDAEVLARLACSNPLANLCDGNLSDYCTALEGVSHFQYITWRAQHDHGVSLLELELQAEVDKYVTAMLLFTQQRQGSFPGSLHQQLFECMRFAAGLNAESLQRYAKANRHAARFCQALDERYLRCKRIRPAAWLGELRRFYRGGQADKLRWAMA